MGAYLSKPNCEKLSEDVDGTFLRFGASSMQGWRISQEDAHSCIIDYDNDSTSLFGVYDGHGGSEVADYTAEKLPDFLKKVAAYSQGNLSAALEDAFLDFDATLTAEDVKQQLAVLAGGDKDGAETDEEEKEEAKNEAAVLCEEASMPIEKLLERYGGTGGVANRPVSAIIKSSNNKNLSPVIRPKQNKPVLADGSVDIGSNDSEDVKSTVETSTSSENSEKPDLCIKLADKLLNGCCENVDHDKDVSTAVTGGQSSTSSLDPDNSERKSNTVKSDSTDVADGVTSSSECAGEVCTSTTTIQDAASASSSSMKIDNAAQSTSSGKTESSEEETTDEEEDSDEDAQWKEDENEDDSDDEDVEGLLDCDGDEEDEDEDDEDEDDAEEMEEGMNFGEEPGADSGCTAVVALLRGNELYVANSGDSRCVLCRAGKAVEMSIDHKPEDTLEHDRIIKAGGRVTGDGRVNGGLNLSRAIGDHIYKRNTSVSAREQMITALPDVKSVTLGEEDQFMVLACDGIWNVMSSQDVVDFVSRRLECGVTKLSEICEEMFDFCLAPDTSGDGTGCDNMTCVIVVFRGKSSSVIQRTSSKRKAEELSCDGSNTAGDDGTAESAAKKLKEEDI